MKRDSCFFFLRNMQGHYGVLNLILYDRSKLSELAFPLSIISYGLAVIPKAKDYCKLMPNLLPNHFMFMHGLIMESSQDEVS